MNSSYNLQILSLSSAYGIIFCFANVKSKQNLVDIRSNVKNSQFAQPLFEFSGACSGSWTSQANKFERR